MFDFWEANLFSTNRPSNNVHSKLELNINQSGLSLLKVHLNHCKVSLEGNEDWKSHYSHILVVGRVTLLTIIISEIYATKLRRLYLLSRRQSS